MSSLKLARGHVYHSRHQGVKNSFRYPTFSIQFDCAEAAALASLMRKRFSGFVSFSSTDYLHGEQGDLKGLIKEFIELHCDYDAEKVVLQTMPRMLGYVFNPVSFWYCWRQEKLEAVLVEVNNTFGERHFYWIRSPGGIGFQQWYRAEKVFHVSPFQPVDGYYRFRFQNDDEQMRVDIHYYGSDEKLRLATWVTGRKTSLESTSLFSLFARYGWMTPLVVARIHFQALKLWFKGSRFYRKPALPRQEVSS